MANVTKQSKDNDNANNGKWRFLLPFIAVLIASIAIVLNNPNYFTSLLYIIGPSQTVLNEIGQDGLFLFQQADRNRDGVISIDEFKPIAVKLKDVNITYSYDIEIAQDDIIVTLIPSFKPLLLNTMRNDQNTFLGTGTDYITELKEWTTPALQYKQFGASHFKAFLPSDYQLLSSHDVYYFVTPPSLTVKGPVLGDDRYYPPLLLESGEILVHRLLSMFHPRPFVFMRFAPQGAVACVRAYNDLYVDIVFRIHAEFQLNKPPRLPFWFTPAQFSGHITMTQNSSEIVDFSLYVPNDKRLNVDMEWLTSSSKDNNNMEVDIGYMPQMELRLDESSERIKDIHWTHEITQEDALRRLEVKMYPFKEVVYYNFSQAFTLARQLNKPVHSIMLWGVLDDQSC